MKINHKNQTIEMSKKFAKAAEKFGSEEYKQLQEARGDNPGFKVVTVSRKASGQKESYKGLTYSYMENYIKTHDESGVIMAEFEKLRDEKMPYGAIRKWFFEQYPQFKSFTTKTQWVLAA